MDANAPVPHSSGTERPRLAAPPRACDCHMHIYDARYAPAPHWKSIPPVAPVDTYRRWQQRIGTTRTVVVQPSTYGTDNRCTVDAVRQLGPSARAVAVLDTGASTQELEQLNAAGVRGVRVNFVMPQPWGITTPDRLHAMARRVAALGWHVQVFLHARQIVEMQDVLANLPAPLVIDHLGRLPQPEGCAHPAHAVILRLLDQGRTWIKLSGVYMDTVTGPPSYRDMLPVARSFVRAAPERVVWGSDWPHPTQQQKPDDAALFDLLLDWADDEPTRRRILVDNPERLYGFNPLRESPC